MVTTLKQGTYSDYVSENFQDKQFTFILKKNNQDPSYTTGRGQKVAYPPSYRLKLVDSVYCPIKKMMRDIRYIPGEMSIYTDEQTDDKDKPKKEFMLEFVHGEKYIRGTDALLIKYLMLSNKNGSNPTRDTSITPIFLTLDPGTGLESVMATDEKLTEAQHFCYKGDWDEVAAYAMTLGLDMSRDTKEIRYSLRLIAAKDPDKFLKGMKDKSTKRKYYVMQALSLGVIKKNIRLNSMEWGTGTHITTAPMGRDIVDYFVEATFTDTGERIYNEIVKQVLPEGEKEVVMSEVIPKSGDLNELKPKEKQKDLISMADITNVQLANLIDKGVEQGIIKKNGAWSYFEDEKYQGDKLFFAIKSSPDLLSILQEKLN